MISEILYYIRRALAELTGQRAQRGKNKQPLPGLKTWRPVIIGAGGLVVVIIFISIIWVLLPYGKNGSLECAFRIPDPSAPEPVTAGDAVRLDTCVTLEKAVTPSSRTLGLSNRPSMPQDRGMLFDFEVPGEYCMWMKDMYFDLDIIWLNEKQEIIDIKTDISPDTYPQAFCGPETGHYVIEVNAGIVNAADLRKGHRLHF